MMQHKRGENKPVCKKSASLNPVFFIPCKEDWGLREMGRENNHTKITKYIQYFFVLYTNDKQARNLTLKS